MSKMVSHDPFGHLKHNLWSKEGLGVKLTIWLHFRSLKVGNIPDFFTYRWCATYHWKALIESYNFALNFISIGGLHTKLWDSKITNVLISGIRDSNLGVLRQNDIWVLALWLGTWNNIRGEVVASPKFGLWWVLWVRVYSWFIHASKVLQLLTNQHVVRVHVSNWITYHSSLSPSQSSITAFYRKSATS